MNTILIILLVMVGVPFLLKALYVVFIVGDYTRLVGVRYYSATKHLKSGILSAVANPVKYKKFKQILATGKSVNEAIKECGLR